MLKAGNEYKENETWQKVQDFLPKHNQLNQNEMPVQEWVEMEKMSIHVDHYIQKNPKATIIMLHGVGGNGRLLSFIALALWRLGYEIICPDLPMYGHTVVDMDISYENWIETAEFITEKYYKEKVPMLLFGLSAGGMLAYQTACRAENISGVIVTCLLDQRIPRVTMETASSKIMAVVGKPFLRLTHKIAGRLKLPMKTVCNMKAIVNNKSLAEILMKDPISSGASVSLKFLNGLLNPEIDIEAENFRKCPILLVHPQKDYWTDVSLSRLFFDKLSCKKELRLLEGAGHFPIEEIGLRQLEDYCSAFISQFENDVNQT